MLEAALLSIGFAFFLVAFGLYHLMVFRVNRHLNPGEQFPHSLSFGERDQLRALYKSLYPRSIVYQLTMVSAVTMMLAAVLFVCVHVRAVMLGRGPTP